jgi:hypothetical protein
MVCWCCWKRLVFRIAVFKSVVFMGIKIVDFRIFLRQFASFT